MKIDMADKIQTAVLLESGNIRTPRGRILYPALFKPRNQKGETDKEKAKYQCGLLIPKGSDIKAMEKAVAEAREGLPKMAKIKLPFLKTEDQPTLAEYADDYPILIRCNSTYKPEVVGPTGKAIAEEDEADEVYMGRWGRLSVRAFTYNRPDSKGVSFGLQNAQMLDHADPIAGGRARAEAEFDAVGDGLAGLEE